MFFLYLYAYLYVSKCLVLSVVVPVHFMCFTVGEWETFLSIPCMSDMQEIDNKATLTLTKAERGEGWWKIGNREQLAFSPCTSMPFVS